LATGKAGNQHAETNLDGHTVRKRLWLIKVMLTWKCTGRAANDPEDRKR